MADIYQLLCWQGSWRPRQVAYFIPLIVLGKSLWCFYLLAAGCFIRNNDVCLKMFCVLAKGGCFSSNAEKSRTWSPTGDVAYSQRLQDVLRKLCGDLTLLPNPGIMVKGNHPDMAWHFFQLMIICPEYGLYMCVPHMCVLNRLGRLFLDGSVYVVQKRDLKMFKLRLELSS